jgi:ribulose-5-phosphate 4-epimerase/fuculose-1-phosphate aldolase
LARCDSIPHRPACRNASRNSKACRLAHIPAQLFHNFSSYEIPVPLGSPTSGERFIHSEIYKARPDVQSAIHAHSMAVIPAGLAGTPLRPVVAQAGFLLLETPLFDSREVYGAAAKERGMLVRNAMLGAALAKKLGNNPVVLMGGHGMTVVADSIKRATAQAVYTRIDAQTQLEATQLHKNITSIDEKELASSQVEKFDLDRPWDNFKNKLPKWPHYVDQRAERAYLLRMKVEPGR